MRNLLGILVVVCLVLTLPAAAAAKGDAAAGKTAYASKCASCHGAAGEGKEAIGKMFKVTLKHLGDKEVQAKDDATLKKDITTGNGKMKPVALSDTEVANVIAYVRTLKK